MVCNFGRKKKHIILVSVVVATVVVITDVEIGVVATEGDRIGSSKMLLAEGNSVRKMVLLSDFFFVNF